MRSHLKTVLGNLAVITAISFSVSTSGQAKCLLLPIADIQMAAFGEW
jgi:hypothetical protein